MNNPKKIYLQGPNSDIDGGRSWCQDRIYPDDVAYTRVDLIQQLIEEYQDKVKHKIKIRNNSDSPENISIINRKLVVYQGIIDKLKRIIQ